MLVAAVMQKRNDIRNHPAVEAWVKLDSTNKIPNRVISLYAKERKRKNAKSTVFKLESDEQVVVAKQCSLETAELESLIYQRIIRKIPLSTLHFFGYIENREQHWLFIEYAGGKLWDPKNPVHQCLAAEWLANLHCYSSEIEELSLLPEKNANHYFKQQDKVALRAKRALLNARLAPDELYVLDEIYRCLSLLERRWPEIEVFCDSIPVCLGHNDFIDKNIQVAVRGKKSTLLAFDWEMSARSIPAADLHWMLVKLAPEAGSKIIKLYWMHRKRFSDSLSLADIEHLARLGVVFRYLDALEWASRSFEYKSVAERGKRLANAKLYTERLAGMLITLSWT